MSTVKSISLKVEGEALTSRAREYVLSGEWIQAINFLVESLDGMNSEYAQMILSGSHCLIGIDPDINLVEEAPEKQEKLIREYTDAGFRGFIKEGNSFFQPYSIVNNLGIKDFNEDDVDLFLDGKYETQWKNHTQSVDFKIRENAFAGDPSSIPKEKQHYPIWLIENRVKHYLEGRVEDKVKFVKDSNGRTVGALFRKIDANIPMWLHKAENSAQEAFNINEYRLPITGHAQKYTDKVFLEEDDAPFTREERYQNLVFQLADGSYRSSNISEHLLEPLHESNGKSVANIFDEPFDLSIREINENEDRLHAKRIQDLRDECDRSRKLIKEFADNDAEYGWYEYQWKDPKKIGPTLTLRAPKRALYCYALSKTAAHTLMPEYSPFSPMDLKTSDDNQYHSDVWLGCGFDLDEKTYHHDSPEYKAIIDMRFEVQKELLNYDVQILAKGPDIYGPIVFADADYIDETCILVLPHAGVEFELQAMKAGAVICEKGGKLTHLVTVFRESNKSIVRMENALSYFKNGHGVQVSSSIGKVQLGSSQFDAPIAQSKSMKHKP